MKLFFSLTAFVFFFSCNNQNSQKQELILHDLDSINRKLAANESLFSQAQYDTLLNRAWNSSRTQQFHYTIHDFHAYMDHLRSRFYLAMGDTTGGRIPPGNDIEASTAFFKDRTNGSDVLFDQLDGAIDAMLDYTRNEKTRQRILQFKSITTGRFPTKEKFTKAFFTGTPPVAVVTILNSFENTVRDITYSILLEYNLK
jgi:hypothetical protein